MIRILALIIFAAATFGQAAAVDQRYAPSLAAISADSMRADVSFLASDALAGRSTPSPGLDAAAEYIAAKFKLAGLDPAGEDGYFQAAALVTEGKRLRPVRPPAQSAVGTARNTIGLLRGSDPVLRDEYVLVTAHHDHVGINPKLEGDRIHNGANDNASGVAAVLEVARVLSAALQRPKRSIIFACFFGEERGLLGSRYFTEHPPVPLSKIIVNLNLEHMGRSDDDEDPRPRLIRMTGAEYSDVAEVVEAAAAATGTTLAIDPEQSRQFFRASDNYALARKGIVAHTLCSAFIFEDYHKPGDEWPKLDYPNMEAVVRTAAVSVVMFADRPEPPQWKRDHPDVQKFLGKSAAQP